MGGTRKASENKTPLSAVSCNSTSICFCRGKGGRWLCDAGDDWVPEDCNYTGLKCTALQLHFDRKLQPQQGEMSGKGTNKAEQAGQIQLWFNMALLLDLATWHPLTAIYYPVALPTRGKITNFLRGGMALALEFYFSVGYEFLPSPQMSTASPAERGPQWVPWPATACQGHCSPPALPWPTATWAARPLLPAFKIINYHKEEHLL